jgi:hypothetical protein
MRCEGGGRERGDATARARGARGDAQRTLRRHASRTSRRSLGSRHSVLSCSLTFLRCYQFRLAKRSKSCRSFVCERMRCNDFQLSVCFCVRNSSRWHARRLTKQRLPAKFNVGLLVRPRAYCIPEAHDCTRLHTHVVYVSMLAEIVRRRQVANKMAAEQVLIYCLSSRIF